MERIQTHEESEDGGQSVDAFASVMGHKHSGHVRLYGRDVTMKILKDQVGDPGSSDDQLMQQKIEEIEERMTQKGLQKLEDQRDAMQQEMAINIITRLQHPNPGLQLDPDILAFYARFALALREKLPLLKVEKMQKVKTKAWKILVKKLVDGFEASSTMIFGYQLQHFEAYG